MSIWGWVAIGVVVLALILFAIVALGTVRHLMSLKSAIEVNTAEINANAMTLQRKIAGMQGDLDAMQQRVQITQERIAQVKG